METGDKKRRGRGKKEKVEDKKRTMMCACVCLFKSLKDLLLLHYSFMQFFICKKRCTRLNALGFFATYQNGGGNSKQKQTLCCLLTLRKTLTVQ